MDSKHVRLMIFAVLLVASLAGAAVWQLSGGSGDAPTRAGVDTVPASRSIFPKVLKH
jgi:hypothetical protein